MDDMREIVDNHLHCYLPTILEEIRMNQIRILILIPIPILIPTQIPSQMMVIELLRMLALKQLLLVLREYQLILDCSHSNLLRLKGLVELKAEVFQRQYH